MPQLDLELLLQREDSHVEWKKEVAKIEDVVKTLAAFANDLEGSGQGGWVLCGIEEVRDLHSFSAGRPVGLTASRLKEVQGKVLDWCRSRVSPPLVPSVEEALVPGDPSRRILAFYAPASPQLHALREENGSTRHWVRFGSQTREAQGELLRQLQQRKGEVPPFLERPCPGATLEDLDLLAAREFLTRAKLPHPPEEYLRPGVSLDALSSPLILSHPGVQGELKPVPTYLALLLFSLEPPRWIPGAFAVFSAYPGTTRTAVSSIRSHAVGPLPSLIRDLLERLQLYTGISIDKSASAIEIQQNRLRYSDKALQEAVVNAFAHRDYESREPVRITVFSDRIEIASPGGFVPGMDPERLRRGEATPKWRNPALASFLLRLQLSQNEGQGIRTIIDETLSTAGREASIIPGQDGFEVSIPAFRPVSEVPRAATNGETGGQGLILISIGGNSIRPVVEHSLPELGLGDAEILVDFVLPEYVQHWEAEAERIRDQIRVWVEDPGYSRLHLFYRGPVVLAPLLGALVAPVKSLIVYYHEAGRYTPAYVLDRRFLLDNH